MSFWLASVLCAFVAGLLVMELINRWIFHCWLKPVKRRVRESKAERSCAVAAPSRNGIHERVGFGA